MAAHRLMCWDSRIGNYNKRRAELSETNVSRIALLHQHHLKLKDVQEIVASLSIFEDAASFLDQLREDFQVLIVSDAFIELAIHFSPSLGLPEIQCHSLSVDDAGYIDRCIFLPRRGKEETIRSLRKTNHCILAVGDAFNDLEMLRSADLGFLFRPSQQTLNSAGDLTVVTSYHEILHAAKNGRCCINPAATRADVYAQQLVPQGC